MDHKVLCQKPLGTGAGRIIEVNGTEFIWNNLRSKRDGHQSILVFLNILIMTESLDLGRRYSWLIEKQGSQELRRC